MEPSNQPDRDTATQADLAAVVERNRLEARRLRPEPSEPKRLSFSLPEADEFYAEREAEKREREKELRRADLQRQWDNLVASAGGRYRDVSLENYKIYHDSQKAVLQKVKNWADSETQHGLVLYGPVGTGKDHLAFGACRAVMRRGKRARWLNGQTWFGTLRDNMDSGRSEAGEIASLTQADVLCVSDPLPPAMSKGDDLTPYQASMLYRLIDARYVRELPTIITVNFNDDDEADRRLGAASWDRLCHDAYKLKCAWPSYRRPKVEL